VTTVVIDEDEILRESVSNFLLAYDYYYWKLAFEDPYDGDYARQAELLERLKDVFRRHGATGRWRRSRGSS
jgi:hypothetical protein